MLNKRLVSLLAAGASVAGLSACTTLPVTTDSNPNLSVSSCHTYTFAHEHVANSDQPAAFGNPLNAERLRVAIEANLAAKGLQRVDEHGAADCVVGYAMGSRQVFNDYYGSFGVGFGSGFRRGGWGGWGGFGYDGPWVQDETRISVDLFEAQSRKPIWHATVSQNVSDLRGPNAELKINAATAAIFAKFPGGAVAPVSSAGRATT